MKKLLSLILFVIVSKSVSALNRDTLKVHFQSEGYKLSGKIFTPANRTTKMPAIIFLVGSGNYSLLYEDYYKDFIGYYFKEVQDDAAIMYFDKRGHGQSEGLWYKTDFEQRALDAKNAAEYLKTLPSIDSDRIYVVGHSQGGWLVQICLSKYPDVFAGGVSMAGATFSVKQQITNEFQSSYICSKNLDTAKAYVKARKKTNSLLTLVSIFPVNENLKQLNRIKHFKIEPYLKKIEKPILYLWGENDRLVSPDWCINELKRVFPNGHPSNIQTYIGKGQTHAFQIAPFCTKSKSPEFSNSEETRKVITDWFLKNWATNIVNR